MSGRLRLCGLYSETNRARKALGFGPWHGWPPLCARVAARAEHMESLRVGPSLVPLAHAECHTHDRRRERCGARLARCVCVCVSDGRVCHGCMYGAHDVCALTKSVLHTDSSDETECRCRQLRICSEVCRSHLVLCDYSVYRLIASHRVCGGL